jgi:acetylornithine/succinyldiaminopimelate/putrescine aminotransferase
MPDLSSVARVLATAVRPRRMRHRTLERVAYDHKKGLQSCAQDLNQVQATVCRVGQSMTCSTRAPLLHSHKPSQVRRAAQAFAGIVTVSVGHCHPRVNAAIAAQSARLQHTTSIYLNDQLAAYARELVATLPDPLKVRSRRQ